MKQHYYIKFCQSLLLLIFLTVNLYGQSLNEVKGVKYEEEKDRSFLVFELDRKPDFEIVSNQNRQVLTIKLRNSKYNPKIRRIEFRGPHVGFIETLKINNNEFWIKIKLNLKNVEFKVIPTEIKKGQLVIQFKNKKIAPTKSDLRMITRISSGIFRYYERVVIRFSKPFQYEISEEYEPVYRVKILILNSEFGDSIKLPTLSKRILSHLEISQRGKHVDLVVKPRFGVLSIKHSKARKPDRLVMDFTKIPIPIKIEEKKDDVEEVSLDLFQNQLYFNSKFAQAEKTFLRRRFVDSASIFKNIYYGTLKYKKKLIEDAKLNNEELSGSDKLSDPEIQNQIRSVLDIGLKARFRSADAYFQKQLLDPTHQGFNFAIQEYIESLNAAHNITMDTDDKARALYNIGRSYHNMKFYDEAANYYQELLRFYPNSPFSGDAIFKVGSIERNLGHNLKTIEILTEFIKDFPDARQISEANYRIAQAYYNLKDYKNGKQYFDMARRQNPDFMLQEAELMFQMGETYFENQQFDTARGIYETLLEKYPNEKFSNLVAIRIGDFFREVAQLDDAIETYKKAINKYPQEVTLTGLMRIANIYAERPFNDDYKKALNTYNFILQKHPYSELVEEALLRKGLTLSLFKKYDSAIKVLEVFAATYPDNVFVKNYIIRDRIFQNILTNIKEKYFNNEYFDVLSLFEKHRKEYLRPLPEEIPLFLIADSYKQLGLRKKAINVMNQILENKNNPLQSTVFYNIAVAQASLKDHARAQNTFLEHLKLFKEDIHTPEVLMSLGKSYVETNQLDKAVQAFKQVITRYSDSKDFLKREKIPEAWYQYALINQELGNYQDALKAYSNVLESFNHSIDRDQVIQFVKDSHYLIGDMYNELDQFTEALQTYQKAVKLYPDYEKTPWAEYQIAQIYENKENSEKALKIYDLLLAKSEKTEQKNRPIWVDFAIESKDELLNKLKFDKYLQQSPSAKADGVE